ncbi:MAG: DUF1501 domain-containing protein [Gemmataceae bacterium]|nr:DUF1501 domain-containing protein [Gemmataceae bacterium]
MSCSRREVLKTGLALSAGVFPTGLLNAAAAGRKKTKTVIFLHQWGGPSHLDTFDMKPLVPDAYRSPYKPAPSSLAGVPICDRLPQMAKVMDRVTLVRSVHHEMKNHNSAGYYSLSGYAPPSDDQRLRDSQELFPAYGSIVSKFSQRAGKIPAFCSFPHVIRDGSITPGQQASFLGKSYDPFFIGQDPNQAGFSLPELVLPDGVGSARLANRREMMDLVDRQTRLNEVNSKARGIGENYSRAMEMLTSTEIRKAFDLSSEPQAIRERYGRTTYGQSCLLARRLAEAGASFINVYFSPQIGGCEGGWDTHGFREKPMYPIMDKYLLPLTDQTLPTLILDLEDRGLLDSTLVFWAGEFGRTPKINNLSGRDHWPQCYTVLFAGGGIKRGYVHGVSDAKGAFPSLDPVRPEDLSATLFYSMGIDPKSEVRDSLNRPLPISPGKVIEPILA